MKQKTIFAAFLLLFCATSLWASTTSIDGVWYDFNTTSMTATVTYRGSSPSSYSNEYSGSVVIPESVTYNGKTYSVTGVRDYAFEGCTGLTFTYIPNSVTSIGERAFWGCSGLTSVNLGNGITSIGNIAFYGCNISSINFSGTIEDWCNKAWSPLSVSGGYQLLLNGIVQENVTIPNSVTSIRDYSFYGCNSLSSVVIGNSVTSIGDYAFSGCNSLSSVIIGNSVTSIGKWAFRDCSGLTSIKISNSVTCIGDWAFVGCSGLTSVTIGNNVTSIGEGAFYMCSSLISVTIPNSVTSIGRSAFRECSSLTSVTIPNSVTSIGDYAFSGCRNMTSVTIGSSVTSIGGDAFSRCTSLTSIIWNAKNCNSYNFGSQITSFTFGYGVEHIPAYLCRWMDNLTSITIPQSVKDIGEYAFDGCKIKSINFIGTIEDWCNKAWSPSSISAEYQLLLNGELQENVTIPNSVTSIGDYAFSGCNSLSSVIIGNSATSIGDYAFSGCNSLSFVIIGNSVTSIGKWAFRDCRSLTSVTIPNSVTSIGDYAFSGCSSLTDIYATCGDLERVKQLLRSDNRVKYAPLPYSITINAENGHVNSPQNSCDALELSAIPDYGYHFTQWSDGNTDNPRTIVLTKDTTFTAEFDKNVYSASLTCDANRGTIEGPQGEFEYLTELIYTASPKYGYHIDHWECNGVYISSTITAMFSVPDWCADPYAWIWKNGKSGHWEKLPTVNEWLVYRTHANDEGIIIVPNGPTWVNGQTVELYLTESACYTIENFESGKKSEFIRGYDCWAAVNVPIDDTLKIQLHENSLIAAIFEPNTYSISASSNPNGEVSGTGSFAYLTECSIEAIPYRDYHFTKWSDGNTDNPRTVILTQDTVMCAIFEYILTDKCGKDSALTWTLDTTNFALSITGKGELTENYSYGNFIKSVNIGKGVSVIGADAFRDFKNLIAITLSNSVTSIGNHAFSGCSSLASVTIPNSVTSIGTGAFSYCSSLTSVIIPNSVTSIANHAFYGCSGLTSVIIPEGCDSICDGAFSNCGNITSVTVPSTLTYVGAYAFNTQKILDVYNYATTPQDMSLNNYYSGLELTMLRGILASARLHVPQQSIGLYSNTYFWCYFGHILPIQSTTVETNCVNVSATETTATVVWPQVNNATTYELVIKDKNGNVICTLVFDGEGKLLSIAFGAPARDNSTEQVQAVGFEFTVTGLESGTSYNLTITAKDNNGNALNVQTTSFVTEGNSQTEITNVVDATVEPTKVIRNGQLFILRGDKTYTVQGQEVR